MTDDVAEQLWTRAKRRLGPLSAALRNGLGAAVQPLLFGLRLWASVCLALYVAFWLELDNAYWAGTSAAIVCQPQLGASLRKGWFRVIGTVIGAIMIVVLTGFFPQDRIGFLGGLALWGGLCAFAATLLRNFASYAAALAGYTAAIIAADTLGATGGASPEVFMLAIWRASEICIGIVCAGLVLALTDLGGAQRQLAGSFAALAAAITGGFARMLALAGPELPDTQAERRELTRRVIALDPMIDQALGESSQLRYHSPILQTAVHGLFIANVGWARTAMHLRRLPEDTARQGAETILRCFPPELRSAPDSGAPIRWTADPIGLRRVCEGAIWRLLALPADTPSLRLLADQTAKALAGILYVLDGLALLLNAPGRPLPGRGVIAMLGNVVFGHNRGFRLSIPDFLPAYVNAVRASVTISVVALFWVVTAWPNGAFAIVFAAIVVLLLSPRGDMAYGGAIAFALGSSVSVVCAAIIKFAVLPGLETFPAFCAAIGLFLIPTGFAIALSRQPSTIALFSAMGFNFVPLLAPSNQMSYDTAQFYNSSLAIVVGCAAAPLAFVLLPPLSPALRARRLLARTLRDLRRLAIDPVPPTADVWDSRVYGRLAAMPDEAQPLQRAQLMVALSVGSEIIHLRRAVPELGLNSELDPALDALAQGDCATAIVRLERLDCRLATLAEPEPQNSVTLRARARILVVHEALVHHRAYFEEGARS
jgi:uncharacterized membrane protein YccC